MNSPFSRQEEIFANALKLPTAEQRSAYLDEACAGDEQLRQHIDTLLAAYHDAGTFLQAPADSALDPGRRQADAVTVVSVTEMVGDRIGRYKLIQRIGEGGMGVVYMAEQEEPVRRRVALKIIKLGMDTRQVVARFEAERQALAMMDHPNIARVLDGGATDAGRPYFVMELVQGVPITEFCDRNKLNARDRLKLFIQVCQAIQSAHQKGIIHRDIKPSNVLVTLHHGEPMPKVIDFGVAKATNQKLTEKTLFTNYATMIGTPAYMSPEQAEMTSMDVDTRTDVYALGVLLYELLTGTTPFPEKRLRSLGYGEMQRVILEEEPERPSTRLSTMANEQKTAVAKNHGEELSALTNLLKGDLDWVVMRCLEKDRRRRYDTPNELVGDLQRHLNNEPVVARPPSAAYRFQKLVRRNKLAFAGAAGIASALVLGVVVSTWQAIRARRAERTAQSEAWRARQAEKTAREESALAKREEQRANFAALEARQNLYAADMNLAYRAREEENLGLALELLNKHRPQPGEQDLRGWEWRYLWGVCQSDELRTLATNSAIVSSLVISPDGSLLASTESGLARAAVKLCAFPSGQLLAIPETNDAAGAVAFSPDGRRLAFTTRNQGLKLWDVASRQEIARFPGRYGGLFAGKWNLVFSPDGKTLADSGAHEEAQVLLWNLETKTLAGKLGETFGGFGSLAFSPDGGTLIGGGFDSTIRLWSVGSGQEIARLTNHTAAVASLALSSDGKTLASAGWIDNTIRIWDLTARRQIAVLTNHTRMVYSVAFSSDDQTLASASGDCTIKLWETARWEEISTLRGNLEEVWAVAFSRDGETLISGAKDGTIKSWSATPRIRAPEMLNRPSDSWWWMLQGSMLSCFHTNWTVTCWNAATLREIANYVLPKEEMTNSLGFGLASSGKLAWSNKEGEIVLWDLPTRRQVARFSGIPGGRKTVAFSPDGKRLVAAVPGRLLTVWDVEKQQVIATLPKSQAGIAFAALHFSPDLHLIGAGNFDGTVEVWDLTRNQRVAEWQAHQLEVMGISLMPDGKRLVTCSLDATVKLWDIDTRQQLKSFSRTLNAYFSLAIIPDGQGIAAGTWGGFIKIWSSTTGLEMATLRTGDWNPHDQQLLPLDENALISLTQKAVRVWRAPSWEEIAAAEQGRANGRTEASTADIK